MWLKIINFHKSQWRTYLFKNRYIIEHDAGSWLKVDSRTGEIQLSREFDKKSKYITNGIYTAEILAVDGKKIHFQYFNKIIIIIPLNINVIIDIRLTQIKYLVCLQDLLRVLNTLDQELNSVHPYHNLHLSHNLFYLLPKKNCMWFTAEGIKV